ncbi:MAG: hypothetical protein J5882_00455 [Bacteroidales bacterium]|nr:hypothetical protein [Bacteroidales bacterium]
MKAKVFLIAALAALSLSANAQIEGVEFGADLGLGYIHGADKRINGNIGCNLGLTMIQGMAAGWFYTHLNTNSKVDHRFNRYFGDDEFLYRSNYTGLYFKKTFFPKKLLRFSALVKGGIGGTNYSNHVVTNGDDDDNGIGTLHQKADKCFVTVVEPGAQLELKIRGEGIIFSLGATYRKYGNLKLYCNDKKIASADDLDGVTVYFGVTLRTN